MVTYNIFFKFFQSYETYSIVNKKNNLGLSLLYMQIQLHGEMQATQVLVQNFLKVGVLNQYLNTT